MEETTANILKCDYCFPEEYFFEISDMAKEFIKKLLVLVPGQRMDMDTALTDSWIREVSLYKNLTVIYVKKYIFLKEHLAAVISCSRLKTFMQRRHPINIPNTPTSPIYTGEHIF